MFKWNYNNLKIYQKAKMFFTISPLEMKPLLQKSKNIEKILAINEVSILRQCRQAASLQSYSGKKFI
jgi:hypothetical protein